MIKNPLVKIKIKNLQKKNFILIDNGFQLKYNEPNKS